MPGVPGSNHPQFIDVVHREHAVVETAGVRTAKAMGLRNLPQILAGQQRLGPRREHRRRPGRLVPASSAFATTRTCGTLTRKRSATGSGTSPPGWLATPASES